MINLIKILTEKYNLNNL